jgi:hypothetical protein
VADPKAERGAWKMHFEKVSADEGLVQERVWQNIPKHPRQQWMGEDPTEEEMTKALRCMQEGKAGGDDDALVEYIKHGGERLKQEVFRIVQEMWREAAYAEKGKEGERWPKEWKIALQVPLWKKKGDRKDKNTWRGITLLSVGSKLLARVVSARTQKWSEPWQREDQDGFRKGRGVDDTTQVTRRLVDETMCSEEATPMVMSFYDIEKAYPRVCRAALWQLMASMGADDRFIAVCKALHEATEVAVKVHGGVSDRYTPARGLREGCPSSPPLFNVYHYGVMTDFEQRRAEAATDENRTPGVEWDVLIDGSLHR